MINIDTNYINECLIEDGKTIFFTITNEGYLDYTKNMIESLKKLNIDKKILIICTDKATNEYFKSKGYFIYFMNVDLSKHYYYGSDEFSKFVIIKLFIISKLLELNYNLLYTDSDIVYFKNPIQEIEKFKYIEGDMWIQNDTYDDKDYRNVCSGFIYIRSNEITKKYFNIDIPEFQERYDLCKKHNNDQTYIILFVLPYLNTHLLPLNTFPNGKYFYQFYDKIKDSVVLVHFNWVVGHEKKERMKKYNMWLI